jgi:hypothetical protein
MTIDYNFFRKEIACYWLPAWQPQAVRSPGWAASSAASLKIPAPPLKPVSASAASTTAAAVQLDRSRGNGAWLANCQPVQ